MPTHRPRRVEVRWHEPDAGSAETQASERHCLLWAASGSLLLEAAGEAWRVPTALGLWVPSGIEHRVSSLGNRFVSVHCTPAASPIRWTTVTAVSMTGFLREAILRLSTATLPAAERRRTEAVFYDAVHPIGVDALNIPVPGDPRLIVVTQGLLRDPASSTTLVEWGRLSGASAKTLARLFKAEMGMSFSQWRTLARLQAALSHLGGGATVAATAREVGYSTPSAFIHAFRGATGTTPGRFARSLRDM